MDTAILANPRPFIAATEVWLPSGDRLVHGGGDYADLTAFEAASIRQSFARGEGLPGKAWAEGRPVVLKSFDGSYFLRAEAAREAGLTAAVALPVFDGKTLLAVLVVLCAGDDTATGAIEVWRGQDGLLMLADGYYGAARQFEWVSQHTHFPKGQGLPGGVWAARAPILMRDLGSGYSFIRSESAGAAGLSTGLGLPVPLPGDDSCVVTLLSAAGTPIAHRFEIWDARAARVGAAGGAELIDGICDRDGPLWDEDNPPRVQLWQGPIGQVLGTGLPVVLSARPGLAAGYNLMVALPIHRDGELSHIVAWYI